MVTRTGIERCARVSRAWAGVILSAALVWCPPGHAQDSRLVIAGGTLIDGNGGMPVDAVTIVVEGNRIVEVTTAPDPGLLSDATVIDADGQFILPGLWDAQVSYNWYYGEVMLNHGITSTIDVGNSGELAVAQRDGVINGHLRGPRAFTGISRIIRRQPSALTALETTLTQNRGPQSAEDYTSAGQCIHRCHRRLRDLSGRPVAAGVLPGRFRGGRPQGRARVHPVVRGRCSDPGRPPRWARRISRTPAGVAWAITRNPPRGPMPTSSRCMRTSTRREPNR